jgi:hypothetical protein
MADDEAVRHFVASLRSVTASYVRGEVPLPESQAATNALWAEARERGLLRAVEAEILRGMESSRPRYFRAA